MKILLYIISFLLASVGFIILFSSLLDSDLGWDTKTFILLISSLFLIPAFLIFEKNRGRNINSFTVRFITLYTFSILLAIGSVMSFLSFYQSGEGIEAAIVYAIFSILFFIFKKRGKIGSSGFASKLQNLKNFELKEFSDQNILDLLGKNITINKKTQVNIPFKFELELNGEFSAEADKYGFDVVAWNKEVSIENRKNEENKEMKKHYESLYATYDQALQTYQLAQQTRKAAFLQAGENKKGGAALLLTAGDKKPKEPSKPAYHKLRNLNKSDFLTNNEGIEKFNDQKISKKNEYAYFNFLNKDTFMNVFDFKEYENIKKIINEILNLKDIPDFSNTNIDYDAKSSDIEISFDNSFTKSGKIIDNGKNILEVTIKNNNDNDNSNVLYSLIDQEKYALKNIRFIKYEVDYSIRDIKYIPFLRIDYSLKGEDKVAILDYISRSTFN